MSDNQEPSETLLKYISVLVDTYPKPITRAEEGIDIEIGEWLEG